MKFKTALSLLLLIGSMVPALSYAWWDEAWPYRVPISLDTTATGAGVNETVQDVPVLIRLHAGNFADFFYLKEDLGDLRFVGGDDKTPLSHHVEQFDLINQLLFVWVKVPSLTGNLNTEKIWMYYGNGEAANSEDVSGSFDINQASVIHFNADGSLPQDKTTYGNNPLELTAVGNPTSQVAAGVQFDGSQSLVFPDTPSIQGAEKGLTFSAWIKPQGSQQDSFLFARKSAVGDEISLRVDNAALYAQLKVGDSKLETPRTAPLTPDVWQAVSLTYGNDKLSVYINGAELASIQTEFTPVSGESFVGSSVAKTNGFVGEMDEVGFSNIARESAYLKAAVASQGLENKLAHLNEGEQLGNAGGTSVLMSIMGHAYEDKFGLGIIISLVIMALISWLVMMLKGFYLGQVEKDNRKFLKAYYDLGTGNPAMLDHADDDEDEVAEESPISQALFGDHKHFNSSPIYHMYHKGLKEVRLRVGESIGASSNKKLTNQASAAIRASMEAFLVREMQKINSKMVLLTIAISGGPFLGLLGTVVGVMITFAGIAQAGDVNINAIAPGMSAALLATVAGLAVAIPALFGYNYLGSKIKDISADMQVFVDEFITKVSEYYGE